MERFVINTDPDTIEEVFGIVSASKAFLEPNFNANAGHTLPIIRSNSGVLEMDSAIWGIKNGKETITGLDADEALKNPEYLKLLKSNSCIIPVNGFYKWKQSVKDPLPFFVRIHTQELLGIAGFYVENEDSKNTFCAFTTEANVLIKPLDDTMPCILNPMNFNAWLNGNAPKLLELGFNDTLLLPEMTVFRVPDLVNDVSNNSKELIQPIPKLRDDD